jgi:bifunctional DNA-binding transcriptional regulator/antitoxin component of YhaV-PrlF toxin-antitoxin module
MTMPAEVRRELGIEGEATFLIETEGDRVILRRGAVVPAEDAWAYTPEHRALLKRALDDAAAGRVLWLSPEDLAERAGVDVEEGTGGDVPADAR